MLSQIQRSWISSPLGSNLLLVLFKNNNANNNCVQLETLLINKKEFNSKSEVYYSNINDVKNKLHLPENVTILSLRNFKEDIKEVLWLLELPIRDNDFKLMIIVPNEVDVMKLILEGFSAATASIQPFFTYISTLNAPCIKFDSLLEETQKIDSDVTITKAEVGSVEIDNIGVSINVFTCIFLTSIQTQVTKKFKKISEYPFYFSLVFKDTSIFNGKYIDVKKPN
ncbi:unnamed protein product, partial [Brenthis ino]